MNGQEQEQNSFATGGDYLKPTTFGDKKKQYEITNVVIAADPFKVNSKRLEVDVKCNADNTTRTLSLQKGKITRLLFEKFGKRMQDWIGKSFDLEAKDCSFVKGDKTINTKSWELTPVA